MNKFSFIKYIIALISLTVWIPHQSFADKKNPDEKSMKSPQEKSPKDFEKESVSFEVLDQLRTTYNSRIRDLIDQIELNLDESHQPLLNAPFGDIKKQAFTLLREVKEKAGISATVSLNQKVYVQGLLRKADLKKVILGQDQRPSLGITYLPNSISSPIKTKLLKHKHGLYFNLINLVKTTTLIHLKANYYQAIQQGNGRIKYETKIEEIKSELFNAYNFGIEIQDVDLPADNTLMIFADDVSMPSQYSDFDMALMDFVIRRAPELKMSSEAEFLEQMRIDKFSRLRGHWKGLKGNYEIDFENKKCLEIIRHESSRTFNMTIARDTKEEIEEIYTLLVDQGRENLSYSNKWGMWELSYQGRETYFVTNKNGRISVKEGGLTDFYTIPVRRKYSALIKNPGPEEVCQSREWETYLSCIDETARKIHNLPHTKDHLDFPTAEAVQAQCSL